MQTNIMKSAVLLLALACLSAAAPQDPLVRTKKQTSSYPYSQYSGTGGTDYYNQGMYSNPYNTGYGGYNQGYGQQGYNGYNSAYPSSRSYNGYNQQYPGYNQGYNTQGYNMQGYNQGYNQYSRPGAYNSAYPGYNQQGTYNPSAYSQYPSASG